MRISHDVYTHEEPVFLDWVIQRAYDRAPSNVVFRRATRRVEIEVLLDSGGGTGDKKAASDARESVDILKDELAKYGLLASFLRQVYGLQPKTGKEGK